MDLSSKILLEKLLSPELTSFLLRASFCGLRAVLISCIWFAFADAQEANGGRDSTDNEQWRCGSSTASQDYISIQDLDRLRKLSRDSLSRPAAFSRLSPANGEVVAEALRVGPRGAFFAARVLRDLMIIDALDTYARCGNEQCTKPAIISDFQINRLGELDAPKSWQQLRDLWIKFRDDDAGSGAHCLDISRGLPTASTEVPIASASEKSVPGKPVNVQPGNDLVAADAGQNIPPQLVGLDPADLRYCQVRSANSADQSQVSDEEVRQLREDFRTGRSPFFDGLRENHREPLEESLRVGPKAGYFAHHALRILLIIKEIDRVLNCTSQQPCSARSDVQELKRNNSWKYTLEIWKSIRDTDLNRALACMKYSKTLPTLVLPPLIAADTTEPARTGRVSCGDYRSREVVVLQFAKNQSKAAGDQLAKLSAMADMLRSCGNLRALVAGHTDQDGSRAYNIALSRARASTISDHLAQIGVGPTQIMARGYGETRPVAENHSREAKARNRRVEVQLERWR